VLERDIRRACLYHLAAKGIVAWRSDQIPSPVKDGGFRRFAGRNEVSDILGNVQQRADVVGSGPIDFAVFLAVEGKRPSDRPSEEQAKFLVEIRRLGGIVVVACSVASL